MIASESHPAVLVIIFASPGLLYFVGRLIYSALWSLVFERWHPAGSYDMWLALIVLASLILPILFWGVFMSLGGDRLFMRFPSRTAIYKDGRRYTPAQWRARVAPDRTGHRRLARWGPPPGLHQFPGPLFTQKEAENR